MKHIVVLGGSGFLGSRVVDALSRAEGLEVKVASRRGPLVVDVTKPETFEALRGSDLVIDLTDATTTRPDAAIAWCLDQGMTVIEATSDAPCVERLALQHEKRSVGHLVLGGGIFTGVSNLLVRNVATDATSVTLGIATSPFSAAGTGTIALMVRALGVPTVRYVDGARTDRGLEAGPTLDFGGITRKTVRFSVAEPFMIHKSLGTRSVEVVLAPKPGLLATMFLLSPTFLFTSTIGQWLMQAYFTVLRRFVFRSVSTSVELVANASNAHRSTRQVVTARDGMMAGAWALAAMTEHIAAAEPKTGVHFIDELTSLRPIIERANGLAQTTVLELTEPIEVRKNEP